MTPPITPACAVPPSNPDWNAVNRTYGGLTVRSLIYTLGYGLLLCCQGVQARESSFPVVHGTSIFDTELVFDRSEAPVPRMGMLVKRQDGSTSSGLPTILAPTGTASSTTSESATSTTTLETATPSSTDALPRPFDTSLGNNFTAASCPQFFQSFLTNQTFQDCMPFSLLLQTSSSFFSATRSPLTLVRTLDASCSIPSPSLCTTLMSSLATQISSPSNCGRDLSLQNPQAQQAHAGFLAYNPLSTTACLKNADTGNYCFADAVQNTSAPTSSYIYYLPLGVQLPAGTRPACTQCLKDTMAIFSREAGKSTSPLHGDYGQASDVVSMSCGPGFAEQGVSYSGASGLRANWGVGFVALVVVLFALLG